MKSIFFVSCPLGFEKNLTQEISRFWFQLIDKDGLPTRADLPDFEILKGGVEFETEIHLGLQINFFTKIGLRVLLRIARFKVRYYDQVEKEFKKMSWNQYFNFSENPHLTIQFDATKSRLNNEKNLIEAFSHVLPPGVRIAETSVNQLMVRIENDFAEVSVNTSGEHLHFRGYRKEQGEAPIRENLAALLLDSMGIPLYQKVTVVDPFVGAGTLLFEAALVDYPHLEREYDFLKSKYVPPLFKSDSWKKNYRHLNRRPVKLIGIEKDPQTFKKWQSNLETFSKLFFPIEMHCFSGDSLQVDLSTVLGDSEQVWVVANPPYGERLKAQQDQVLAVFQRLVRDYQPHGMIILHPIDWTVSFASEYDCQKIPFSNQGLRLTLSVFKRAPKKSIS